MYVLIAFREFYISLNLLGSPMLICSFQTDFQPSENTNPRAMLTEGTGTISCNSSVYPATLRSAYFGYNIHDQQVYNSKPLEHTANPNIGLILFK